MKKIDCLGEICPVPIINLQRQLNALKKGEPIVIVTDHSCTLSSVADFCKMHHFSYDIKEVINGVWEITVFNNLSK